MNERKGAVLGVDGELTAMQCIRRTLNKLDQRARYRVISYFAQAVADDTVNGVETCETTGLKYSVNIENTDAEQVTEPAAVVP